MKINFDYDKTVDVMYISINEPKSAKIIEQENGTLLRIDPITNEKLGMTIIDFTKKLNDGFIENFSLEV